MPENAKTPEIRFAGFTDAWEQRAVKDLAERYDNLRVPITASDRVSGNTPYYGANGIQDYVAGFTHDGEFILVAEDGANDLHDYPVQYVNFKVWVNNHTHVLQAKSGVADNKFLMYAFKHTDIEPYLVGGGRAKLNADTMMKICFPVPKIAEQAQIGQLFANLDHLITLHQREHDKTVNIKKAMLEKMFPKEGADKPEIRFAGFTDAWEQRKLGDVVEFFSGLTYSPNDVTNNGTLVLRSSNVKDGAIVDADNVYVRHEAATSDNVQVGDVIVVVRNGSRNLIGKHAQVKQSMFQTVIGAFMTGVRSKIPEFTNALLDTQQFDNETRKNLGATINQITTGMFKKMTFWVPAENEQAKLGAFFSNLDNLIALHRRESEKLQNMKRALLEKMFV